MKQLRNTGKWSFTMVVWLLSLPLWAHDTHSPLPQRTAEDLARKQTEMMVRELHLTDNQVIDSLYQLHLRYALLYKDTNASAEVRKQRREDHLKAKKALLTPDQWEAYVAILERSHRRYPQALLYSPSDTASRQSERQ